MKKFLLVNTLLILVLLLACGCNRGNPKYLPGENEGDSHFIWLCQEPFGFFFLPDDDEGYYGFLKGRIEKDGELRCFYSAFNPVDGRTYFLEEEDIDELFYHESFSGHAYYSKNDFSMYIKYDPINFFDGELPTLQFDKMTKEDFLEQYGDIENLSELLEIETADIDEVS